jgi:hypothetical protein
MFKAGASGNPRGRPKGTVGGRVQALAGLDRLLAGTGLTGVDRAVREQDAERGAKGFR